jgi:hypothetical protein
MHAHDLVILNSSKSTINRSISSQVNHPATHQLQATLVAFYILVLTNKVHQNITEFLQLTTVLWTVQLQQVAALAIHTK